MPRTTAKRLADYILSESEKRGIAVTNLKLQKLLYYCQGWYLAFCDEPLFPERIEAWIHGPAVPPVFGCFKEYRWKTIPGGTASIEDGSPDYTLPEHVSRILDAYGDMSGRELEMMTHAEKPWIAARGKLPPDVPSNAVITDGSMREYFREMLERAG
jgi:uncharacterized phage-associated protein